MLTLENIEKLLNRNLAKLTVSIDGASKEVFEKIRVKSNFEEVIQNAKNFKKLISKKLIRPEFSAWSTIQETNYSEIDKIAKLCKEIGFDDLTFQVFLTGWGKEKWQEINNKQNIDYRNIEVINKFNDVIKKYSNNKFRIRVFEENLLSYKKKCSWPFNSTYISAKGYVVPCCIIADPNVVNMGNVNNDKFNNIWFSKNYDNFRINISQNNLEDFCKNCYLEHQKK